MISQETDFTPTYQRDTQTWVQMLRGECGVEQQRTANEELTRHFSAVALRCLHNRKTSTSQLDSWTKDDIIRYAGKVVDATMAELLLDDFREFESFDDERLVTFQAAQLVIDHITADLARR